MKPAVDLLAEILDAVVALERVPRESMASMPDMLFHNRRVARRIKDALGGLEVVDPTRIARAPLRLAPKPGRREQISTIVCAKGKSVRVVRKATDQLDLGF
ncbi:MAG: hypothetical protein P4M05_28160 [Bradyrhizobium sp.]|nr:hypothetical protein [Bradyrhizobium sp.]